ncbi:MAG: diacylglycerol kinase family lipid kinase [Firmicutes bacterium]|nr:diacylglycerol kinase family lipid kinase [Bacillota bacterium]
MYHCIINPVAGRGTAPKIADEIKKFMTAKNLNIDIIITEKNTVATELAKTICKNGSKGIICVGGDGTLQEVVTGMLADKNKCNIPLGIISRGSGNDFKRSLKPLIGKTDNFLDCLQAMTTQNYVAVDAIKSDNQVFLNIANCGIDAAIVKNALPFKKILGKNAYLLAAFVSIAQHKNIKLSVNIDENTNIEGKFTLAAICNGSYYGGGIRVAPQAILTDGKIILCLVNEMSKIRALTLFPVMLLEKHVNLKEVTYFECKKVSIIPQNPQKLCVDGNLYDWQNKVNFEILPKAILVC